MDDQWINGLMGRAYAQQQNAAQPRTGIVASVDAERYLVRVKVQPNDILTGWLPVAAASVGALSIVSLPSVGAAVQLIPQEGSPDGYVVTGVMFSRATPPPKMPRAIGGADTTVQPGEHGVCVGNTVFFVSAAGFYSKGAWMHEGTWESSGNMKSRAEVIDKVGSLDSLRDHYNAHRHTGVQAGAAQSGTTTQPDP